MTPGGKYYNLPCITCINTENNRDANKVSTDVAIPIKLYETNAEVKATIKAIRSPNKSPSRPYNGPPAN